MKKDNLKGYLLIIGLCLIVITPIFYVIYNKIVSKKLNESGVKTTAIIQNLERTQNIKTRTYSYYITLKYQDDKNKEYIETLPISFTEYKKRTQGEKIEVLYDKDKPQTVEILDYKKFKNTEERILHFDDLIDFQNNKHPEYILETLNHISYGWEVKESDSTFFINKLRKSYLIAKKDSVKYVTNVANYNEIQSHVESMRFIESDKIQVGYIDNPFLDLEKPKKNILRNIFSKKKKQGEFILRSYEQHDLKRKMWNVMSCVK